jgi:SAM-dependent methyltransferase
VGFRSLRHRGVRNTIAVAASFLADFTFDWKYGTETHSNVKPEHFGDNLDIEGSVFYQATKAAPFLAMLHMLDLPARSVFMDVGCGKGKVLLLAASATIGGKHRFQRVVGLDFSPKLCKRAIGNIHLFPQVRTGAH